MILELFLGDPVSASTLHQHICEDHDNDNEAPFLFSSLVSMAVPFQLGFEPHCGHSLFSFPQHRKNVHNISHVSMKLFYAVAIWRLHVKVKGMCLTGGWSPIASPWEPGSSSLWLLLSSGSLMGNWT